MKLDAKATALHNGRWAFYGLLTFFFAVYWVQGVEGVWHGSIQPGYIRSFGIRYEGSGVISTARFLPWWLKILVALPQDRYSLFGLGHRLPYAFLGLCLGLACLASISHINPKEQWGLYLTIIALGEYGVSNADAAADGMAVDHAANEHGSLIQGVMSAGRTIGGMLTGAIAGKIVGSYGRQAAVYWLVATFALSIPTVFFTKEERPPERDKAGSFKDVLAALWKSSKQRRFIALAAFIILGQVGNSIAGQPLSLWVMERFYVTDEELTYMNVSLAG